MYSCRVFALCIFVVICIVTGGRVRAQSVGPEFRVNSHTALDQTLPAVAMNPSGEFVVVWQSDGQDGSDLGIYGQRFDAAGGKAGSEFRVNTFTAGDQADPAVAMRDDGSFLVSWWSWAQDGDNRGVFARLYDTAGNPVATEFQVNTTVFSNQAFPDVAVNPVTNGFVITWSSAFQDGSSDAVIVRLFDANAGPISVERMANTHTLGYQGDSRVECDDSGNFVVIYDSWELDGDSYAVGGRRYRGGGATIGPEFQANTYTTENQDYPDVAVAPDGRFVAVWHSGWQDGSGYGVYFQRYNNTGNRAGGEKRVNDYLARNQWWAKVTMDDAGNFAIVWQSDNQDGDGKGVFARRYQSDGMPDAPEFRVNTHVAGDQERPDIASDPDGNLVVVWQSGGQDGSGFGIYGQRFTTEAVPVTFVSVSAEVVDGSVDIRWDISGRDPVSGFNVYRSFENRDVLLASMLSPGVQGFMDDTVDPGNQYVYTIGAVDAAGNEVRSYKVIVTVPAAGARLLQNRPNPFNPSTTIEYVLGETQKIDLGIYDTLGRLVKILDQNVKPAGRHVVRWDGRNGSGAMVSSGIYYCRLKTGNQISTIRMVLLK